MRQFPYKTVMKVSYSVLVGLTLLGSWSIQALANLGNLPDVGLPGRRVGGGTRDSCYSSPNVLQALTPKSNLGKTTKPNPSFFVYLPPNNAQEANFALEDASANEVYTTSVSLTNRSGIVQVTLPEISNSSILEEGKNYKWSFQLICGQSNGTIAYGDFVEGWIVRQAPDTVLEEQLASMSLRDRAERYASLGIWYDSLEALAQARNNPSSNPTDSNLEREWKSLLTSVGLVSIAEEPLIPCCQLQ